MPEKKLPAQPKIKPLRPVHDQDPEEVEVGQDGYGWDAGTFTVPSPINDDAGGF